MSVSQFEVIAKRICKQLYQSEKLLDWKTIHTDIEVLKRCYGELGRDEQLEKTDFMRELVLQDNRHSDQPFSKRSFLLKNSEDKSVEHWMNKIMAKYIRYLLQLGINAANREDFFKSDIENFNNVLLKDNSESEEEDDLEASDSDKEILEEIETRIEYIKNELKLLPKKYCEKYENEKFDVELGRLCKNFKDNFSVAVNIQGFMKSAIMISDHLSYFKGSYWSVVHFIMLEMSQCYKSLSEYDRKLHVKFPRGNGGIIETTIQQCMQFHFFSYVDVIVNYPSLQLFDFLGPNTSDAKQLELEIIGRIDEIKKMARSFSIREKRITIIIESLDSFKTNLSRAIALRKTGNTLYEIGAQVGEKVSDLAQSTLELGKQSVSNASSTMFYYKDKVANKLSFSTQVGLDEESKSDFSNNNSLFRKDLKEEDFYPEDSNDESSQEKSTIVSNTNNSNSFNRDRDSDIFDSKSSSANSFTTSTAVNNSNNNISGRNINLSSIVSKDSEAKQFEDEYEVLLNNRSSYWTRFKKSATQKINSIIESVDSTHRNSVNTAVRYASFHADVADNSSDNADKNDNSVRNARTLNKSG